MLDAQLCQEPRAAALPETRARLPDARIALPRSPRLPRSRQRQDLLLHRRSRVPAQQQEDICAPTRVSPRKLQHEQQFLGDPHYSQPRRQGACARHEHPRRLFAQAGALLYNRSRQGVQLQHSASRRAPRNRRPDFRAHRRTLLIHQLQWLEQRNRQGTAARRRSPHLFQVRQFGRHRRRGAQLDFTRHQRVHHRQAALRRHILRERLQGCLTVGNARNQPAQRDRLLYELAARPHRAHSHSGQGDAHVGRGGHEDLLPKDARSGQCRIQQREEDHSGDTQSSPLSIHIQRQGRPHRRQVRRDARIQEQ